MDSGGALVNRSGQTLEEIVASAKHVADIVAEIAAASKEQATGIEQVNKAVTQMDRVTQTNAAQTEELSSTAQALTGQAQHLQSLVARFTLGGREAAVAPERRGTEPNRAPRAGRKGATSARAQELPLVGVGVGSHSSPDDFEEF